MYSWQSLEKNAQHYSDFTTADAAAGKRIGTVLYDNKGIRTSANRKTKKRPATVLERMLQKGKKNKIIVNDTLTVRPDNQKKIGKYQPE